MIVEVDLGLELGPRAIVNVFRLGVRGIWMVARGWVQGLGGRKLFWVIHEQHAREGGVQSWCWGLGSGSGTYQSAGLGYGFRV